MTSTSQSVKGERKFVVVPGGKISYDVTGEGPVVLCLPSMGDTRREYERFVPALLKEGYKVITTDLRGMGQSRGSFVSHNIPDLKNDIQAILDAEGEEKAYLLACSISGASAGLFAIEHPERVLGLIMLSPIMHTGPRFLSALLAMLVRIPGLGKVIWNTYFKTLYPLHPVEKDYLDHVNENLKFPGSMKSLADMAMAPRIDGQLQDIKAPTLIFFGSKDPDFKSVQAEADKVQSEIPQARVIVLDGIGHFPQRESSELVLPAVVEWLGGLREV